VVELRKDLFRGVVLGAVVSTLVLITATAMAGTGVGAVFNLGKLNTVNAPTALRGANPGNSLKLTNTGLGSGLGIAVRAGKAPIVVNPLAGKATNLNADKLDGIDSTGFQRRLGFAAVDSAGVLGKHNGATSASRIGTGSYQVVFGANITNCVYLATGGQDGDGLSVPMVVYTSLSGTNTVQVLFFDTSSNPIDRPFYLAVIC
jgi:hypothetical protein